MTEEKAEMLKKIKVKAVHFAWDRYEDKEMIVPKFELFKSITGWDRRKMIVYVLTNFDTTPQQDLERIYTLRKFGYDPDVRIYDKQHTKPSDPCRRMQRWVNNRPIWGSCNTYEEYLDYIGRPEEKDEIYR